MCAKHGVHGKIWTSGASIPSAVNLNKPGKHSWRGSPASPALEALRGPGGFSVGHPVGGSQHHGPDSLPLRLRAAAQACTPLCPAGALEGAPSQVALDQALGRGSECGHITSHQSHRTGEPMRPVGCWREWQGRTPACRAPPEVRLGQGGPRWEGLPSALQCPGSHAVGSAMGYGGYGSLTASQGHARHFIPPTPDRMGLAFARSGLER